MPGLDINHDALAKRAIFSGEAGFGEGGGTDDEAAVERNSRAQAAGGGQQELFKLPGLQAADELNGERVGVR